MQWPDHPGLQRQSLALAGGRSRFLPPFVTDPYATEWQAGYVSTGLGACGGLPLGDGWEVTGCATLTYWANVLYRDPESEDSRATLGTEERAALDELFVSIAGGVGRDGGRGWGWRVELTGGYNLLSGESDWAAIAEAAPEIVYWPVDVYIGLSAGVSVRL